jgi:hypothetical protein
LGVFISPTTKQPLGRGCYRWAHRTVRYATGQCPVRQPRHPTVRVLTQSTVGALTPGGTRQVLCIFRCTSGGCSNFCAHCAHTVALQASVAVDHCARSLCSAWCTRQSDGTPDNPMNYSRVALEKLEGEEFGLVRSWCTGHCPVANRTVRCARPGYSSVSFAFFF